METTKEEAAGTSTEPVRESERETGAADSTGTEGETMAETGTDVPLESAAEPTAEEAVELKNAPFQKQEQEAPQFQWRGCLDSRPLPGRQRLPGNRRREGSL